MENVITGIAVTAGITLLLYVINMTSKYLGEAIKKKKAEAGAANQKVLMVAFEGAEKVLEAVTRVTVSKLESSEAAKLREKVKAGEAKYEDLSHLADTACKEIITQLKPEIQTTLLECIGDLEAYIGNQIESVLPNIKAEHAQAVATKKLACDIMRGSEKQNESAQSA